MLITELAQTQEHGLSTLSEVLAKDDIWNFLKALKWLGEVQIIMLGGSVMGSYIGGLSAELSQDGRLFSI